LIEKRELFGRRSKILSKEFYLKIILSFLKNQIVLDLSKLSYTVSEVLYGRFRRKNIVVVLNILRQ
jgi:hypothetical protein